VNARQPIEDGRQSRRIGEKPGLLPDAEAKMGHAWSPDDLHNFQVDWRCAKVLEQADACTQQDGYQGNLYFRQQVLL
jgi:hypothetical protein